MNDEIAAVSNQVLSVRDLTFKAGFNPVLRNISFDLDAGDVLLVIGPNGAGKSTLLKCLAGLLPYQGSSRIFGLSLKKNYELRKKVGYLGHESFLYMKFSARENLLFYSNLFGAKVDLDDLLADYQLSDSSEQLVDTFSRGMKQKLALARTLLHKPELIFLDEPFTGLDQAAAAMLREKVRTLRAQATMILTTHDLEHGFELCDKVMVLKSGRQVFFGPKDEITCDIRQFYYSRTI
jgi:heme exporter protein A